MRIFKNVCLNPAFPWNFYLIQSLPLACIKFSGLHFSAKMVILFHRLPLGGACETRRCRKDFFSFLFEKSPRKIFSNKGAVYKRTTAQKRTARQSIAPVYQALSPLFMVNGTGIYHKRPVHLFAQHHTHQLMRQSHIRKRKLKIRRTFHLRRQPARRAD